MANKYGRAQSKAFGRFGKLNEERTNRVVEGEMSPAETDHMNKQIRQVANALPKDPCDQINVLLHLAGLNLLHAEDPQSAYETFCAAVKQVMSENRKNVEAHLGHSHS